MKKTKVEIFIVILSIILFVSLLFTQGNTVNAAAKPRFVKKSASVVVGGTTTIKIKNLPKGAKVSYRSNKTRVATVSKKGKVKGVRAGTAKITVTIKADKTSAKLTYKIKVKKPKISKGKVSLSVGKTKTLSVKNKPKQAKYVWTSKNKKVAAVNKKGKITAKSQGTATITVAVETKKKTYKLSSKITVAAKSTSNGKDDKSLYTSDFVSEKVQAVAKLYEDEQGVIEVKDAEKAGLGVKEYAEKLKNEGIIENYSYNNSSHTVSFFLWDGVTLIYSPAVRDTLSGTGIEFAGASIDMIWNDWRASSDYIAYESVNKLASISEYTQFAGIKPNGYSLEDLVLLFQNLGKWDVRAIFWRSHGNCSEVKFISDDGAKKTETVSWLSVDRMETDENKWKEDIHNGNLAPLVGGGYAITPGFVKKYLSKVDGGLFFSGACGSYQDGGILASAFLNAGFDAFVGTDNTVNTTYSDNIMKKVAEELTVKEDSGNYQTIETALNKAKALYGNTDFYYTPFGTRFQIKQSSDTYEGAFRAVPVSYTIQGKVVDVETKEPVENAEVSVYNREKDVYYRATTDGDGNYTAEQVLMGTLSIRIRKDGYITQLMQIKTSEYSSPDAITTNTVELIPSSRITGIVLDEKSGEPIEGAQVTLYQGDEEKDSVQTASDGSFLIDEVDRGSYTLVISKFAYFDLEYSLKISSAGTCVIQDELLMERRPCGVKGTVVDETTGLPLEGAQVTVTLVSDGSICYTVISTTDGSFSMQFPENTLDSWDICIAKEGYSTYKKECMIWNEVYDLGEIKLNSQPTIFTGIVKDTENENGIGNVQMKATIGKNSTVLGSGYSEGDGSFSLNLGAMDAWTEGEELLLTFTAEQYNKRTVTINEIALYTTNNIGSIFMEPSKDEAIWDGSIALDYADGDGTELNPYQIKNGSQLALLAWEVNNGNTYKDKYFVLTADIYLNDVSERHTAAFLGDCELTDIVTWQEDYNVWTPIGHYGVHDNSYWSSNPDLLAFSGSMDGQDHTVYGMYVEQSGTYDGCGLFGYLEGGTVKNLSVLDSCCYGGSGTGGIAGLISNASILSDCTYSGFVSGSYYVGGVVGSAQGSCEIQKCSYAGTKGYVIGNTLGGIVGLADDTVIAGCTVSGYVWVNSVPGGGIVGNASECTVSGCKNTGSMFFSDSSQKSSTAWVGTITGTCSTYYGTVLLGNSSSCGVYDTSGKAMSGIAVSGGHLYPSSGWC